MGDYQNAVLDYSEAIRLNIDYAYAYNNRGYAYLMLNNLEKAKSDFDRSFILDPANAYLYRNLGFYFEAAGDYASAKENWNRASRMDKKLERELTEKINRIQK